MKNKIIILSILAIFVSSPVMADSDKTINLGTKIELKENTKISNILETPKNYLGKKVKIEGKVIDVCKKRGCWMKVSSDKKKQNIFVKVKDGEIVFPLSARGKNAVLEGELIEITKKTKKDLNSEKQHDHKEITEKKEVVYMFKPSGIEIK